MDTGSSLVQPGGRTRNLVCHVSLLGSKRVASRTNAGFCNVPDWNSESLLMMWSAYVAGLVFSLTDNVSRCYKPPRWVEIFKYIQNIDIVFGSP